MRTPVERRARHEAWRERPPDKGLLLPEHEVRQDGDARAVGHELLDRLELRRRQHDVRREARLDAAREDDPVLVRARLLQDEALAPEALKGNLLLCRERMALRQAEAHRIVHDDELMREGRLWIAKDHAEVEVADLDALPHFIRIAELLHIEERRRELLAEFLEERREEVGLEHRRHAEVDRAGTADAEAHHVLLGELRILHDAPRMDQEGAARLRQGDVLLAPVDQRETELRLERLDSLRDRRLRDVQDFRRAREVLQLTDRAKIL